MDIEASVAVEALRFDIHHVGSELVRVEKTLSAKIEGLDGKVEGLERKVEGLDRKMEDLTSATRRHIDVVTGSLRDDIRIVAEGVIALGAKVDALRR